MSLNYELGKCENVAALQADDRWPTTRCLIMMCMVLDVGDLTNDKNVREYYLRARFYESLFGKFLPGQPRSITTQDAESLRGLTTNVPLLPRKTWCKRMTERFFDELERDTE